MLILGAVAATASLFWAGVVLSFRFLGLLIGGTVRLVAVVYDPVRRWHVRRHFARHLAANR